MPYSDIPRIEMTHSSYPIVADRLIKDTNLVSQLGAYFFVLGPLLSFTIILNEIVREKELRLRQGLQVVGVGHSVYWASWTLVGLAFAGVTTVILLFTGLVCQFDVFWNTPLWISFLVFFMFTMAMITMAYFVSTLVSTQAAANQMAYTFVLLTIIFQIVFSQQDINNLFLYNDSTRNTPFVYLFRSFFNLVPSFTFSVCFGAIVKVASTHFDAHLIIWIPGKRYTFSDFITRETGSIIKGIGYTMPSALESFGVLVADVVLYTVLTWYFDHVLSHNRGVADPWYFPFTRKYWESWSKSDVDMKAAIAEARKARRGAAKAEKIIKEDYAAAAAVEEEVGKRVDSV